MRQGRETDRAVDHHGAAHAPQQGRQVLIVDVEQSLAEPELLSQSADQTTVIVGSTAERMVLDHQCDVSRRARSEEHTSELQSQSNLVCRLLLEKKTARRSSDGG